MGHLQTYRNKVIDRVIYIANFRKCDTSRNCRKMHCALMQKLEQIYYSVELQEYCTTRSTTIVTVRTLTNKTRNGQIEKNSITIFR